MHDMNVLTENLGVIMALAPDADLYASDPASDVINMTDCQRLSFLIFEGAGGTGTATVTVLACDNTTPSNTSAIAFKYRVASNSGTLTDVFGTLTDATSSGFTTTAGANKIIEVVVDAKDLPDGYPYVQLKLVEVADSPVDACVVAIAYQTRMRRGVMPSLLA